MAIARIPNTTDAMPRIKKVHQLRESTSTMDRAFAALRLFPDAEAGKDLREQLFARGVARNVAECGKSALKLARDEVGRVASFQRPARAIERVERLGDRVQL